MLKINRKLKNQRRKGLYATASKFARPVKQLKVYYYQGGEWYKLKKVRGLV